MQDEPTPAEILETVAQFLRETVMPEMQGRNAFLARVTANAVDVVRRQIELSPAADAAELARLRALLNSDGDLETLNRQLCERIEAGAITLTTQGLKDHLWETTLAKLAVDQPNYAAYKRVHDQTPQKT